MEIEQTSLWREVQAVVNSPSKPVHYLWLAELEIAGNVYKALKVNSIDFLSNYEGNYADEIIVELSLSGGTYAKRIYPFKENINCTLFRYPLNEIGDTPNAEAYIQTEIYTATLLDTGNPMLESNGMNSPSEETLNLTNIFQIQFQLVNKALEQLRMISVGGVYRGVTTEDVIKAVLTSNSKRIQVEFARSIVGVDMVPASNQMKREHVVIPQGTRLVHIPEYIQKKCGGVYSSGLGYYLQGDYWYVYPCYDTTRFSQASRTLTVINIPTNKLPGIERTYRRNGQNLVVLATGEVRFRDNSEALQLNAGNGTRFADADRFLGNFSATTNNRTVVSRKINNSELVSTTRLTGNQNVQLSDQAINANSFEEYSKLARRQGSVLSFIWENSLPNLIYPGTMVRVLYMEESIIKDVYGVVLKAHHYVQMHGQGMTNGRHICRTMLSIFVARISAFAS